MRLRRSNPEPTKPAADAPLSITPLAPESSTPPSTEATTEPPTESKVSSGDKNKTKGQDKSTADKERPKNDQSEWAGIIGSVTAPIGFFSLALLVIEAPFPVLFTLSHRTHNEFKWTIIVMSLLIITVVGIVAMLTWKDPKNLVEKIADKAAEKLTSSAHAMDSLAARVTSSSHAMDALAERVKDDLPRD